MTKDTAERKGQLLRAFHVAAVFETGEISRLDLLSLAAAGVGRDRTLEKVRDQRELHERQMFVQWIWEFETWIWRSEKCFKEKPLASPRIPNPD
ncbi:hypothetical protein L596_008506 [Steinernema carpocapsae]|uniref:Uncharacterized protein n=1 Tax=Steinernema carpocapsae TaxID=34508 RepID=A0A4U5PCP8_STECR|nr:hypothetical protein L596_008506 [Steinernema carpocapsae]